LLASEVISQSVQEALILLALNAKLIENILLNLRHGLTLGLLNQRSKGSTHQSRDIIPLPSINLNIIRSLTLHRIGFERLLQVNSRRSSPISGLLPIIFKEGIYFTE